MTAVPEYSPWVSGLVEGMNKILLERLENWAHDLFWRITISQSSHTDKLSEILTSDSWKPGRSQVLLVQGYEG